MSNPTTSETNTTPVSTAIPTEIDNALQGLANLGLAFAHGKVAVSEIENQKERVMALIEAARAEGRREGERTGVAWTVGVIDKLHIQSPYSGELDREYKGIKNTIRDRFKVVTGVDPAPNFPVNVELTPEGESKQ